MDNKRIFIVLPLMLLLFFGYEYTLQALRKAHPDWSAPTAEETTPVNTPTTAPVVSAGSTTSPTTSPTTMPTVAGATGASTHGGIQPVGTDKPMPASLGSARSADPTYPMLLSINPQGAGLESVTLNDFWETAEHKALYVYQEAFPGEETLTRPLAMRWITINGQQLDISNLNWKQTAKDAGSATYTAQIDDNGAPLLVMTRTFRLHKRSDADKGFEVTVDQNFTNASGKQISFHSTMNGPSMPARENQRSEDRSYITGNDDGYQYVTNGRLSPTSLYGRYSFMSAKSGERWTDSKNLVALNAHPLMWLGTSSSYFESLIVPSYAGKPGKPAVTISSAWAEGLPPLEAPATAADQANEQAGEQATALAINSSEVTLAPGATVPFNFNIYFGPKWRKLLSDDPYYSSFPRCFQTTLVTSGGMCGFLTFNWLMNVLYWILAAFHFVTRDWGLAIIGLVILVRVMLHPITKRSQIQMLKMGKMGPEVERLKKKFGEDKDALNKAMMGVYKEQGMAPILGCLPMFLQTPIWIALWSALQSTFELRQAGFLRFGSVHLTWIADLSQPDNLVTFSHPLPLLFFTVHQINILPLLMAVVYFINSATQPMPPTTTPEQAQQRKMMKWMSLLFPVMLYIGPSGLNLYILTSTTIGIIESKIIRDHIKQRDAAEKAGRVIVDAGSKFGNKKKGRDDDKKKIPEKKSRLANFLADLQAKAADVQREAQRRNKDRA
jgi:YidC/Oxa1 family membrane protein insertase